MTKGQDDHEINGKIMKNNESRFMSGRIKVLELFHMYLNTTENWAFRLIDNLPEVDVVVGSKYFLKNNFYRSGIQYIEFPVKCIDQYWGRFSFFNIFVYGILILYPWYLSRMAGKVDLLHSHFSFMGWEYRKLAKRLKKPHIVSFYGYDYENLPFIRPRWQRRYRILFKEADLFLCEGRHGALTLARIGCPPEKIKIVRLGVAIKEIPFFRREKKPGELKLLQIATFTEKKGHIYTARAFMKALAECPNLTLTIVGGDPEGIREKVLQELRGTAAEGMITFIDRIDYEGLYQFMRDYHVFIHPSCYTEKKDSEGGAPIVLLDAQATGMPVISTTHCDIPDEVVNGVTGLLTPEKDDAALSIAIKRFYEMGSEEYGRFASAARQHVEKNYDAAHNSKKLAEVYRELIEAFKNGKS